MAGKGGGGAWKVAYADFVTAMMAFFLVMWLCAQNQEVKRAVANYFSDPMGTTEGGNEKKASRTGGMTEHLRTGTVPLQDKVAMSSGRRSHSPPGPNSPATKLVRDWLHHDKSANDYWHKQVQNELDAARWSQEVKAKRTSLKDLAARRLALQLQTELARDIPEKLSGFQRELLLDAYNDINWLELAEDLIGP